MALRSLASCLWDTDAELVPDNVAVSSSTGSGLRSVIDVIKEPDDDTHADRDAESDAGTTDSPRYVGTDETTHDGMAAGSLSRCIETLAAMSFTCFFKSSRWYCMTIAVYITMIYMYNHL
jgi:hypothetical protein